LLHSGSVLDLPYTFKANGEQEEMQENPNMNFGNLQAMAIAYLVKKVFGTGVAGQIATMVLANFLSGKKPNGGGGGGGGSNSMILSLLQKLFAMQCG